MRDVVGIYFRQQLRDRRLVHLQNLGNCPAIPPADVQPGGHNVSMTDRANINELRHWCEHWTASW